MPTSHYKQINSIVELILYANPASVLDVGTGFGKYGYLSREYLELWDGRNKYNDWKRRIDGIETYKEYITPVHEYVYDNIYLGEAIKTISNLDKEYDLMLLIDVIEHFTYKDGMELLRIGNEKCRNIIVSTPRIMIEQGSVFDNPHEKHEFQWTEKHFSIFESYYFYEDQYSIICFIGPDAGKVKKACARAKKERFRLKIRNKFPFLIQSFRLMKKLFIITAPK